MNKTSSAIVRTLLLGTSCLSALGLGAAYADPTGGTVVTGGATITNKGPNNTVINQTTNKALINWDSFSIAAGGQVRFNQPGSSAITVNRVIGSQSSSIYGSLLANGQVWLINGNGILFGKGSQVNVGGLIATTSDISNGDFASGNYSFSGGTGASVVNQGTIHTRNGGSAVLSGASVQNQGLIQADAGTVVLGGASAFTVDFYGDNLLRYAITAPAATAANGQTGVSNSGTISAAGGRVIMTARAAANVADAVVNNTGMISATSAKVQNGEVILDGGDGDVNVGGTITATGTGSGQSGGAVTVTGRNITVADNTQINVSGDAGGGTVRIGGDLHGAGPLPNAASVTVGSATIKADATRRGNGGTLVVYSNGLTDFSGIFSAKGGLLGGDGGFIETSGHTLRVSPAAKVDTTAPRGKTGTWLLDPDTIVIQAGEGSNTQLPPGGTLGVDTDSEDTDYISPDTIIAALATTNVTLEASNEIDVNSAVIYSSANALNLMSEGDINIDASIQNTMASGGGAVNLVAGWDGATAVGAILTTPGAYGNNEGEIFLDGSGGDVFVGSASGATLAAADSVSLFAGDGGNAQLGYHGAGGGDIDVYATADVSLVGGDPTAEVPTYAMIGNGALDGSVSGAITGNVFVSAAGTINLATESSDPCGPDCNTPRGGDEVGPTPPGKPGSVTGGFPRTVGIGNAAGIGEAPPTGSVTILSGDIQDADDANGGFGVIIGSDLAYGDFTLGRTNMEAALVVDGDINYSSAHNLTLLSVSNINILSTLQNSGSGGITLIAGWDGVYDPAHLTDDGHYGNNGGTVNVGGENAFGPSSVGAAHGALNIYGNSLSLNALHDYAQVGYHGAGGGDIHVKVTQNINGFGNADSDFDLQLGNGTLGNDVTGDVTGNITLDAGNQIAFFSQEGEAWLGNHAASGFKASGDLTSVSVTGSYAADFIEGDLGTSADTGGNVFIGFRDNADAVGFHVGGLAYNSPHSLVFATGSSLDVTGSVRNDGTGDVTLVAGWDGHTFGTGAQIRAAGAYGLNGAVLNVGGNHAYTVGEGEDASTFNINQFEDISVGSAGGLTSVLGGDIHIMPAAGYYAQIGYHGSGGGSIAVLATGDLTLMSGTNAHDYAMIGNGSLLGDVTGNITGNIEVRVGGQTTIESGEGSQSWVGNAAGSGFSETGNLLFVTFDLDGSQSIGANIAADLAGGDVTLAITDSESNEQVDGVPAFSSAHTLNLLTAGSFSFDGSVQNAGTGTINIVAGWNGSTFDPAHFGDAGVFGNHSGSITIGGANAPGGIAVGSLGGQTNVWTNGLILAATNGYAQLGYHGAGTGAIAVDALGIAGLSGGADPQADYAQIGHGTSFASNASVGDVTILAASIGALNSSAVTAANLTLTATGGGIGNSSGALRIAASTLQLQAANAPVFLTSPGAGITLTSVNTGTGSFSLAAAGAIQQTGALHTGGLILSTTSGAITLTNTANAIAGNLRLTTPGAATVYNTLTSNVGVTSVGGDFTLLSKGAVNFFSGVQSLTSNITVVAGWDGATTSPSAFGNAGVYGNGTVGNIVIGGTGAFGSVAVGSKSGTTSLYASNVSLLGNLGAAQLGYHGTGGGAIKVVALHDLNVNAAQFNAMVGNGSLGSDVTGAVTGDIDIRIGGTAFFNGTANTQSWLGNKSPGGETGNLTLVAAESDGNQDCDVGCFIQSDILGGDVMIGLTGSADHGVDNAIAYNSSHALTVLTGGNFGITGSLQNSGTGAITILAGWDGHTLSPSSFGTAGVFGNNGKIVLIGGATAEGNAALGSFGGTTSIYAAQLQVTAVHGYAQLGFNGHGTGAILVDTTGNVTLTAGAGGGQFAQIGNGGLKTTGSNHGNIDITAGGDLVVTGGAGAEAYAQIGHGGAESNTGSSGYDNVAPVTVSAANVTLNAGAGAAAYVQIGNGGYKSGLNLAGGTANNGGNITVTSGHAVSLTGNGADAYAQIGNGGSQSNLNAAAAAGGSDSGDIVVHAPNGAAGSVTLASGAGANAYSQIGNGGYSINAGATTTVANWTVTGNVTVTDLSLTGGGTNGYSQIGNGDAAHSGTANISGNIVIDANGQITYQNGTGPHSTATIGNFTGQGTVMGTLEGAQPPSDVTSDPVVLGNVASNTANNGSNTNNVNTISTVTITVTDQTKAPPTAVALETPPPKPGVLDGDSSSANASDSATIVIADSLDGAKKAMGSQSILPGMLKQSMPGGSSIHGVPPADQDFSSWGNEALWQ